MDTEARGKGPVKVPPGGGRSVWLVGDLIEVKLSSEDTGGAYSLVEETTPPGGGPPPHSHLNEDETLYVLEGEVEFLVGEDSIPAGAGSCVYAPRGILHTWMNVGAAPSRMLGVITPGGLERFFLEAGEPAAGDASPPPGPPDIEKVMAAAARYGVDIPPPPEQTS
ncbi:cupin domain-containing protein [Rubrobacter tropicus]|nr:cupin domain-containing protein [Rubrobacter tropicus]